MNMFVIHARETLRGSQNENSEMEHLQESPIW